MLLFKQRQDGLIIKIRKEANRSMDCFQKIQQYFDMAKIDYYSGSIKGLQELIFQATGDLIPICKIEEYLFCADRETKPTFLL